MAPAQVFVGLAKLFAQGLAQGRIGAESIEGLAEVDRQPAAAAGIQGLGVVVVVAAGARIELALNAIEPRRQDCSLKQVWMGGTIGEAQL